MRKGTRDGERGRRVRKTRREKNGNQAFVNKQWKGAEGRGGEGNGEKAARGSRYRQKFPMMDIIILKCNNKNLHLLLEPNFTCKTEDIS